MKSKSLSSAADSYQGTDFPSFFSDQPAQIFLGPFHTKIVFGESEPSEGAEFPRKLVGIVMPTPALAFLCREVLQRLDSPGFRSEVEAELTQYMSQLTPGGFELPVIAEKTAGESGDGES